MIADTFVLLLVTALLGIAFGILIGILMTVSFLDHRARQKVERDGYLPDDTFRRVR